MPAFIILLLATDKHQEKAHKSSQWHGNQKHLPASRAAGCGCPVERRLHSRSDLHVALQAINLPDGVAARSRGVLAGLQRTLWKMQGGSEEGGAAGSEHLGSMTSLPPLIMAQRLWFLASTARLSVSQSFLPSVPPQTFSQYRPWARHCVCPPVPPGIQIPS